MCGEKCEVASNNDNEIIGVMCTIGGNNDIQCSEHSLKSFRYATTPKITTCVERRTHTHKHARARASTYRIVRN